MVVSSLLGTDTRQQKLGWGDLFETAIQPEMDILPDFHF